MSARGQITSDLDAVFWPPSRTASSSIGTENGRQRFCRGFAAQSSACRIAAHNRLPFDRGFSLFELVVVISVVAVLVSVLLSRVLYYQEQAEKTAMVGVAGIIQSALIMQYGRVLTRGKTSDVEWLAKDNPMNWLQQKPLNYAGEIYEPQPLTVEPGNWVFDLNSRNLVYVPRLVNNLKPGKDGKQWIRYHVVVQYEPSRLPSLQNAPPELTGILFEPVEPYSWF